MTADYHLLPIAEIEQRIARFETQAAAAQQSALPSKDWVRDAIHRRGDGRSPVWINRLSPDVILRYGDRLAELFCRWPDDVVRVVPYDLWIGYQSPDRTPRIHPLEVAIRDAQWQDEWGTRWGHAVGGVGATPLDHPLKDWSALDDYLAGLPDPFAPGRFDAAATALDRHRQSRYCFGTIHLALFERLHAIRGMQNLFADFLTHEAEVRRLLAAVADYVLQLIRRWGELGADAVFLTDDWGSQRAMMISPAMWRDFFKPHYATLFAEAHRMGMDVVFHSCGCVTAIVEDLIEVGIDALDPLQPGAMDAAELARRFGGRLAFCGAVDLQRLLAFGTRRQVYEKVRWLLDLLSRPFGGALIIGPANVVTPDIPLENLQALFEAAHHD